MRAITACLVVFCSALSLVATAEQPPVQAAPAQASPTLAQTSPAQLALGAAQASLAAAPDDRARVAAYIALATAHTQRARESGDASHYDASLEALAAALELDPRNQHASKVEAWVRLGRHEFARAAELAQQQCRAHPDDPESWGLQGDAYMELGRSEQAGDAYQQMMNLRPGPGAYQRAAFWRERAGDVQGARALLIRTLATTSQREREQRAWLLVQLAALEHRAGEAAAAETALQQALVLFPGYHYALAALAELQVESGRDAEALENGRRALQAAPHPERRLIVADALRGLGDDAQARAEEDAFLREALANAARADNENLFLVDFFLERRPQPERALEIAEREAAKRRDPGTLRRLARALERNGRSEEAARIAAEAGRPLLERPATATQPS